MLWYINDYATHTILISAGYNSCYFPNPYKENCHQVYICCLSLFLATKPEVPWWSSLLLSSLYNCSRHRKYQTSVWLLSWHHTTNAPTKIWTAITLQHSKRLLPILEFPFVVGFRLDTNLIAAYRLDVLYWLCWCDKCFSTCLLYSSNLLVDQMVRKGVTPFQRFSMYYDSSYLPSVCCT